MRWPWSKGSTQEERAGYSDLILAGLESLASGSSGDILRTSALESCARIWSGALASATVTGGRGALEPWVMAMAGRQLIRQGEIVFVIDVRDGQVSLSVASEWEVTRRDHYRVEVIEPPGTSISRSDPRVGCHPLPLGAEIRESHGEVFLRWRQRYWGRKWPRMPNSNWARSPPGRPPC